MDDQTDDPGGGGVDGSESEQKNWPDDEEYSVVCSFPSLLFQNELEAQQSDLSLSQLSRWLVLAQKYGPVSMLFGRLGSSQVDEFLDDDD